MAQSFKQDSITHRYDSLAKAKLNKADSSGNRVNNKIDATQSKINKLLNPNLNELLTKDKVEKKKQRRDSILFYKKLETQKKLVKSKIHSLEKIQQPSGRYTLQLDSLNKVKYVAKKNQFDLNLKPIAKQKLDSKKQNRDSIQFYKKLDQQKKITENKIDSLHQLNLPMDRYTQQLDSLNKVKFVPHKREILAHKADSLKSVNLSTDNYTAQSLPGENTPASITRGLMTGSKKVILGSSTWLYSYVFYDNQHRAIQVRSNNHASAAIDNLATSVYDFEGKIIHRPQCRLW